MRRVPAILLVLLFSFSLIGPALFVDDESNLPACCRRSGNHHCSMTDRDMADMAEAPSSGPAADALHTKCPFFPNCGAVVPESGPALLATTQQAAVSIVSQIVDRVQAEAGYRISFSRSHYKRGPPTLLIS
jgi:hypothetical protein